MDEKARRKILRRAEASFGDPDAEAELAAEGIYLGEARRLLPEEIDELLNDGGEAGLPTVNVTCYFEDTPVADRSEIEEPLSSYVEEAGIGKWVGSGQGTIGERAFFEVSFEVLDLDSAIRLIEARLRELGVGARTELAGSDGRVTVLSVSPPPAASDGSEAPK